METAEQRKQRLKAMRQAAQETEGADAPATTAGEDAPADHNGEGAAPVLKFRNYALRDEKIEHEKARSGPSACDHNTHTQLQVTPARAPDFQEPEKPPEETVDEVGDRC